MPVTNEPADGYEPARYDQCKNMKTRTRNGRGEPVDVVNYMHQNFRVAKRPPEDPVGGTIRDLSEHYEKCLEGGGAREPRSFALPKFPPGDPRNNPPAVCETCDGTETIFDYGGPFSCGACAEKPEAA